MDATKKKHVRRVRRKKHIRKNLQGTASKPRLSVFRSLDHIYCQAIDDENGVTLVSASSQSNVDLMVQSSGSMKEASSWAL